MKHLIIVTGASRGIGEAVTLAFGQQFKREVHFLLIARDITKLNQVKAKLLSQSDQTQSQQTNNKVTVLNMDFSAEYRVTDYFKLIKEEFNEQYLTQFEDLYVVYNHGTLEFGSVSLVAQSNSLQER
jgi:short-subunit dehydrogenase